MEESMVFKHSLRIRYSEVDQMGVVYYGNYAAFLEVARVEALRSCGLLYRDLEAQYDIMLPVVYYETRYLRPARYDDQIHLHSRFAEFTRQRVTVHTEIYNDRQELLNKSVVKLLFVDSKTGKRTSLPDNVVSLISEYMTE